MAAIVHAINASAQENIDDVVAKIISSLEDSGLRLFSEQNDAVQLAYYFDDSISSILVKTVDGTYRTKPKEAAGLPRYDLSFDANGNLQRIEGSLERLKTNLGLLTGRQDAGFKKYFLMRNSERKIKIAGEFETIPNDNCNFLDEFAVILSENLIEAEFNVRFNPTAGDPRFLNSGGAWVARYALRNTSLQCGESYVLDLCGASSPGPVFDRYTYALEHGQLKAYRGAGKEKALGQIPNEALNMPPLAGRVNLIIYEEHELPESF